MVLDSARFVKNKASRNFLKKRQKNKQNLDFSKKGNFLAAWVQERVQNGQSTEWAGYRFFFVQSSDWTKSRF